MHNLRERVKFAHDEIHIHIIFPFVTLSHCERFHGGEGKERRHRYLAKVVSVGNLILKMVKGYFYWPSHKREFRFLLDEHFVHDRVSLELLPQFRDIEIISGVFCEQIEIN